MHKPTIGSISSGTLKTENLLKAFANELERLCTFPKHADLLLEANYRVASLSGLRESSEATSKVVNDLQDVLNDYAPPFCYFGTLEGDGADFGFWPDRDAIQELIANGEVVKQTAHLDNNQVIHNNDENVGIEINDHGNITIYNLDTSEILLEIV